MPDDALSFLLITPLPGWRGAFQAIGPDLAIRLLREEERAALTPVDALIQHYDIHASPEGYWLCYHFDNEHPPENVRFRKRQEAAGKLLAHALYAIQILLPIGSPNLTFLYRSKSNGLILESSQHRPAYIGTLWAGLCDVPESFDADIPIVMERVRDVFRKPILRLQIPIWLLEQGLTAYDRHIRLLLWATGLDGVTQAGGVTAFSERLCALIGSETEIFPPSPTLPAPKYRVRDVAEHLYLLRTEMAHGLPFHERFRRRPGFLDGNDRPICADFASWRYDQVIEECSAFLLCRALREVLLRPDDDAGPE